MNSYESPVVTDYGSLADLTEASFPFGPEDGASKVETGNHHSIPLIP